MMKTSIFLLLGSLFILTRCPLMAQSNEALDKVMTVMKEMQATYTMQQLSFEVKYVYSNEGTPGVILDSLKGRVEVDGTNYRCLLDNTETIRNERYSIILFNEDRIMYLAKPTGTDSTGNPLLLTRAVLQNANIKECTITTRNGMKMLRITFNHGAPYKKMDMTIDLASGLVLDMQYVVKTSLLLASQQDEVALEEGYDEYASVRTHFFNYQKMVGNKARFDERAFFFKEEDTFRPTAAYKDFKLFLATPNL